MIKNTKTKQMHLKTKRKRFNQGKVCVPTFSCATKYNWSENLKTAIFVIWFNVNVWQTHFAVCKITKLKDPTQGDKSERKVIKRLRVIHQQRVMLYVHYDFTSLFLKGFVYLTPNPGKDGLNSPQKPQKHICTYRSRYMQVHV